MVLWPVWFKILKISCYHWDVIPWDSLYEFERSLIESTGHSSTCPSHFGLTLSRYLNQVSFACMSSGGILPNLCEPRTHVQKSGHLGPTDVLGATQSGARVKFIRWIGIWNSIISKCAFLDCHSVLLVPVGPQPTHMWGCCYMTVKNCFLSAPQSAAGDYCMGFGCIVSRYWPLCVMSVRCTPFALRGFHLRQESWG